MITIPPPPYRRKYPPVKRVKAKYGPPPAAELALVEATFDPAAPSGMALVLRFNRAIDISGLASAQIFVNDPVNSGSLWRNGGMTAQSDPMTLETAMIEWDDATGATTRLTASAATGIVAADGGEAWEGVTDLELPFGG